MKKIFLLFAIISFTTVSYAQKENNVWAFGDQMGLDFNSGSPTFIQTAIRTIGGSASVCDANGSLLFYTQGDTIWNRNNQIMPNGAGIITPFTSNTNNQSSQGQLIVPVINNPQQYYVFSMEAATDYIYSGDAGASRLFYSIVDMSLDNGMGDVLPSAYKVKLDSDLTSEKMIAIPGDSCSIWLLVHKIDDATFKAYKINNNGINTTPVTSICGNATDPLSYALGKMKVSPDGKKLVTTNLLLGPYGCELYDFNTATGVVSNPIVLDSIGEGISACFSPDRSKLYYFTFGGGNGAFYQYDLSQSTTTDIINSRTLIDTLYSSGALVFDAKMGPDNKMYVKMPYSAVGNEHDTIGRVDFPNLAGMACSYTHAALISPQPIILGNGDLPNQFVKPLQDTTFITTDTSVTLNDSLILTAPAGYTSYVWNSGDTTQAKTIHTPGTYWVICSDYCTLTTDTFHVDSATAVGNIVLSANDIKIYPNPATTYITVAINGNIPGSGMVNIVNMLGQNLLTQPVKRGLNEINVAVLPAGVYKVVYVNNEQHAIRWHTSLVISR